MLGKGINILFTILFLPMLWFAYKKRTYNALDVHNPYYE